jgi:hypothetical protein
MADEDQRQQQPASALASLLWVVVAVVLVLVILVVVTRTAGVRPRSVPLAVTSTITAEQVVAAVGETQLSQHLDEFASYPSRMPGSAGIAATGQYIEETFTRLGMTVLQQPVALTVPVTEYCQLLDEAGNEIAGVQVHPFWPNMVRTCTIPEPGITAKVVMGAKGDAYFYHFSGNDPAKTIPLVRLSSPEQWIGLADAGFPAVIFYRDEAAKPQNYRTKELDFPANFPRFFLVGDPELIRNKIVRIRCKVTWQTVQVPHIVGFFEPAQPQPEQEAVIFTAHYDSISTVPDLAPGAEEAASLAALLTTAEFVAEHRDQLTRHTVFIALAGRGQASQGVRKLAQLWGQPGDESAAQQRIAQRIEALQHRRALLAAAQQVLDEQAFWDIVGSDKAAHLKESQYWQGKAAGLDKALLDDLRRIIEQDIEAAQEQLIVRDLARQRSGNRDDSLESQQYQEARQKVEALRIAATASLLLLKTHHGFGRNTPGTLRLQARLRDKRVEVDKRISRTQQSRQVQQLLHSYDRHVVFCLALTTGSPTAALLAYYPDDRHSVTGSRGWVGPIAGQVVTDTRASLPMLHGLDAGDPVQLARARRMFSDGLNTSDHYMPHTSYIGGTSYYPYIYYSQEIPLLAQGRHAMGWVSPEDQATQIGTPEDTFDRLDRRNLTVATRVVVTVAARMGTGRIKLNATPHLPRTKMPTGHVVQAADPNSVIPTRGVENALVVARHPWPIRLGSVRQEQITVTDENGFFQFAPCDQAHPPQDFQAYRINEETGDIVAVKDQGEKGEGSFPSARQWNNFDNPLRLVLFRCAQTDLFYPLHPSSGVGLGAAFAVDRRTLAPPPSFAVLSGNHFPKRNISIWDHTLPGQGFALFNPPATSFYVGLRSASPLDPSLEAVVAFLLGSDALSAEPPADKEIWGPGYLAQDTPKINLWVRQAAGSMQTLDGFRLRRQDRHRVADTILLEQQQLAADAAKRSDENIAAQRHPAALHDALDSLAISMEVYPRIAQTERDAVIGVLFYLFLVIPFSVFVERLVFGFPDVRAQIGGVTGVFAVVFIMLRYMHPAFELVSSGLMVLLGFLTLAMSLFVTLYLFGKFRTNIKELRLKLQKTAEAADVSRAAAAGTAFLLGINNMRKRKVRTAFTCITLVLVTFSLLSLTAVRKETRFKKIAVGQAPYTGLLIKGASTGTGIRDGLLPGTSSLIERFGKRFAVSPLYWRYNTLHALSHGGMGLSLGDRNQAGKEGYPRFFLTNVIGLDPEEQNVTAVKDAIVAGRFFESDSEASVILPTTRAFQLGVTPEMAAAGKTLVYIDAQPLTIIGLFDPQKLEQIQDLDGESFLPYDGSVANRTGGAQALANASQESQISIPQRIPRLPGHEIALLSAVECGGNAYRIAVNMNDVRPSQAMDTITDFIKRWEGFVYYGVGGISYYGRIYRGTQVRGFAEILVPLLIAAAIVLNTMLGSVYERTNEIGVYSAVGLSPTHVHYLFLAEACVYATIGAVAGYLLAHGLGSILGYLDLTAGLAFNYSTLSTVYATMAMITAVLLSTLYPARKAARLAMPSDKSAVEIPQPSGDLMDIDLPFTYVALDAVSVIPFLYDVLEDHGEGSSAEFFCQAPKLIEADNAANPGADQAQSFGLQARCWLKPYDLGVSQLMTLSIRPSGFEGVWSAHLQLERLTGNVESWRRANRLFVRVLRQHFLAWRGLEEPQKDEYLVRGLAIRYESIDQYLPDAEKHP